MPKIVDHDQRRREIVEVTWRFIAREGIEKLNLRDLAEWPGFDRVRAARLLNGLYLQAGLIVSRTHPAAAGSR